VNSFELDSVIVQARLGSVTVQARLDSARLLYKLDSSSAKLDSARIVYRPSSGYRTRTHRVMDALKRLGVEGSLSLCISLSSLHF
jgi:hypothetical protein